MTKRWGLAMAASGIAALLTACGPAAAPPATGGAPASGGAPPPAAAPAQGSAPAAAEGEPKYGGTLVLAQRDAPENMNAYAGVFATSVVFHHFFETLVQYDMRDDFRISYPVIPWLAESWTTPDDKTLIFKLRDGIKWHDGTPLTAEGVVWSLEYLRDPKNNYSSRSNLNSVDKIVAEGNTVKLMMKAPTPTQLGLVTGIKILPKHIFDQGGTEAINTKSVGTGPFSLVSMDRNSRTVFKKFPDYYLKDEQGRKTPFLDALQHVHNMDQSTQQAGLAAGQIDLFNFTDKAQLDAFSKRVPNMKVLRYQFGSDVGLVPNQKSPWLSKKEVRQAINLIFNRQEIIDNVAGGDGLLGLPGVGAMKEGWVIPQADVAKMPGYRQPKTEDLAQAKRLLDQAGVPRDWEIKFLNRATYNSAPQGEQAANQLTAFGLKVKYEPLDDATIVRAMREGAFDIYLELGASADPTTTYNRFHTKGLTNYGKISDPQLDTVVEKLLTIEEKSEQQKLTRQMQDIVLANSYTFSLADPAIYTLQQPWVNGYRSPRGTQIYMNGNAPFIWFDMDKVPAARK